MTEITPMRAVCLFCGSSAGMRPEYAAAAAAMGETLAARNISMIYGGGRAGLMGAAADAALAAGGTVIGVIPEMLVAREVAHERLTRLHVVSSMHERKALMSTLSDAFVALPGGFGTLEELAEVITWRQLGIHARPIGILNTLSFFTPLAKFFDHATGEGFIQQRHRESIVVRDDPKSLIDALATTHGFREPPLVTLEES